MVSEEWKKERIRDELKDARMYDQMGFPEIASDERHHAEILKNS